MTVEQQPTIAPGVCYQPDCEAEGVHLHGEACVNCGYCCPDRPGGVMDARIIPDKPTRIEWANSVYRVALHADNSISLTQTRTLRDEEIEDAQTAYNSALWFRDHLAELRI